MAHATSVRWALSLLGAGRGRVRQALCCVSFLRKGLVRMKVLW